MKKYKKKPVIIEAEQFECEVPPLDSMGTEKTGLSFLGFDVLVDEKGPFIFISTMEGRMRADNHDWIIKGIKGEFYPCKPDIFEATYELVREAKGEAGE